MSQLSIKLSDKADALIAQLQKEIFNRRRKKVTAAGVVETLVESGARSQSDKRFATSWVNLIEDIEKAAKLATAHGSKPSSLTDEEWVMVLSHRNRQVSKPRQASKAVKADQPAAAGTAAPRTTTATKTKRASSSSRVAKARVVKTAETSTTSLASVGKPRKARRARKSSPESTSARSTAGRMAKAAAQLASSNGIQSPARS